MDDGHKSSVKTRRTFSTGWRSNQGGPSSATNSKRAGSANGRPSPASQRAQADHRTARQVRISNLLFHLNSTILLKGIVRSLDFSRYSISTAFLPNGGKIIQVVKMLVAVVVLFTVCWSPYLIDNVLMSFELLPGARTGPMKHMRIAL